MPVIADDHLSEESWSGRKICLFSWSGDYGGDRLKYIENISVTGNLAVKQRID
jgi:hypothetical protein